jgi:hypothetical protein
MVYYGIYGVELALFSKCLDIKTVSVPNFTLKLSGYGANINQYCLPCTGSSINIMLLPEGTKNPQFKNPVYLQYGNDVVIVNNHARSRMAEFPSRKTLAEHLVAVDRFICHSNKSDIVAYMLKILREYEYLACPCGTKLNSLKLHMKLKEYGVAITPVASSEPTIHYMHMLSVGYVIHTSPSPLHAI